MHKIAHINGMPWSGMAAAAWQRDCSSCEPRVTAFHTAGEQIFQCVAAKLALVCTVTAPQRLWALTLLMGAIIASLEFQIGGQQHNSKVNVYVFLLQILTFSWPSSQILAGNGRFGSDAYFSPRTTTFDPQATCLTNRRRTAAHLEASAKTPIQQVACSSSDATWQRGLFDLLHEGLCLNVLHISDNTAGSLSARRPSSICCFISWHGRCRRRRCDACSAKMINMLAAQ